jgi:hypothetical protein
MTAPTHRDALRRFSPPWLQRGLAEKVLYAIGAHIDAVADAAAAGVKQRFPGLYSNESLPLIGRERRIRRGRIEADATYASRLIRWLDDHRRRGGPYAMLAQVFAFFAPASFPVALVYYSGRRYRMDTAGAVVRDTIQWKIDTNSTKWARWWLFYSWPTALTDNGVWDGAGTWDEAGVWDSTLSAQDAADIALVPKEWNAAHAIGRVVLFQPTAELWDYPPDSTWDEAGVWDTAAVIELAIG